VRGLETPGLVDFRNIRPGARDTQQKSRIYN